MEPTNNKALYHTLGGLVDKLLNGDVKEDDLPKIDRALKASQQMINLFNTEISRVKTLKELAEYNKDYQPIEMRQIEGRPYDRTDGDN